MNKRQAKKQRQKLYTPGIYILEKIVTGMSHVEEGKDIAIFSNPETYKKFGIKRKFRTSTNNDDFTIEYKVLKYKLMGGNTIYLYSSEELNCDILVCIIGDPPHKYKPIGSITMRRDVDE